MQSGATTCTCSSYSKYSSAIRKNLWGTVGSSSRVMEKNSNKWCEFPVLITALTWDQLSLFILVLTWEYNSIVHVTTPGLQAFMNEDVCGQIQIQIDTESTEYVGEMLTKAQSFSRAVTVQHNRAMHTVSSQWLFHGFIGLLKPRLKESGLIQSCWC